MDPRAGVCHGKRGRPGIVNSFAPVENPHTVCRRQKRKKQNIRKVGKGLSTNCKCLKARLLDSPVLSFTGKQEKQDLKVSQIINTLALELLVKSRSQRTTQCQKDKKSKY